MDPADPDRRGQHGRPLSAGHVQRSQIANELFYQTPRHCWYSFIFPHINVYFLFLNIMIGNDFRFKRRRHQRLDGYCLENHSGLARWQHCL